MLALIRLVTVHAVLVHLTLGGIPLVLLAYGIAAWRRSAAFSLAGDVALFFTAAITLATSGFGLVSSFVLDWPGGLDTWRWLHLGFGAATTLLLAIWAPLRYRRRRHQPTTGPGSLGAALVLSGLAAVTGWIGGEVLVFHAGMAVKAAGLGALAPPTLPSAQPPAKMSDAMGRMRAHWSEANVVLAQLNVDKPTPERFASIAAQADAVGQLAQWIVESAPPGSEKREHAGELGKVATALAAAARAHNAVATASQLGQLTAVCIECHEEHRWKNHRARNGHTRGG